jgi:two-component system CheB/CheR fusion protein
LQREADRVVLARYGPAGVVVDESMNILQFRGHTGPYLEPSPGVASLNLLKMAREGLLVELRKAVIQAKTDNATVRREGLLVKDGEQLRVVNVEIVPLRPPGGAARYYLVAFEDGKPPAPVKADGAPPPPKVPEDATQRIAQLQQELDATREYLQTVVEQHEAATEELKSSHEEILSSYEELQSTNEEMQTAKEEMQSANEELVTVNEELRHRNQDLAWLNDDLVNLYSGINIPIVMVDRNLRIRRLTPPAEKVFNLIPTDVGRSITDIRPSLDIPDLDQMLRGVIETLTVKEIETQGATGRWYAVRIRPYVTLENKIDGASITALDIDALKSRDVTQVQQARDTAEAVIESVSQPLLVLDPQLRVELANAAFYRLAGTTPDDTLHRPLDRIGRGEWDHPELRVQLGNVIARDSRFRGLELTIDFHRGGHRRLLFHGQPVAWQDAPSKLILLVMEDVTERRREVQQALQLERAESARTEAESATRSKDEFLAMLAHELRNPLAPLANALHILRHTGRQEPQRTKMLEVAGRQVHLMGRLLEDLLDVSRVSQGKIVMRKEPVDMAVVVARAVETTERAYESAKHTLNVALPPEPIWLEADPVRIEQVLVNLLNNACKYTPPGGRIDLHAAWEDPGFVTIRVKDTGMGIPPEMLPRIFELFTQATRALDRAQGGLGIGLTLARKLVELHGGTIEARSEGPNQGSEFIVRLPAHQGPMPKPPPRQPVGTPLPSRTVCRVLVVDDNRDAVESLAALLRLGGHTVRVAHSGPEALEAVRREAPEIVFLDIGLPGMDGYAVAQEMRKLPGMDKARIVALTGYGQEEDRKRSAEAGIDQHLVKPSDRTELYRVLELGPRPSERGESARGA